MIRSPIGDRFPASVCSRGGPAAGAVGMWESGCCCGISKGWLKERESCSWISPLSATPSFPRLSVCVSFAPVLSCRRERRFDLALPKQFRFRLAHLSCELGIAHLHGDAVELPEVHPRVEISLRFRERLQLLVWRHVAVRPIDPLPFAALRETGDREPAWPVIVQVTRTRASGPVESRNSG